MSPSQARGWSSFRRSSARLQSPSGSGSGRPVLFRQVRPGLYAQPFTILKFRTMRDLRDPNGELLSDGDRLTPLGRVLRAASLDELPELWNVVRGDMSLVGPRPLLMRYLDPQHPRPSSAPGGPPRDHRMGAGSRAERARLGTEARPGCRGRPDHRSFALDLKILVKTVGSVLRRVGISQPGSATVEEFTGTPEATLRT